MGMRHFVFPSYALICLLCWISVFTVNGNWTEWSEWTSCSVTCGAGVKKRFRFCNSIPIEYGGEICKPDPLSAIETAPCKVAKHCSVDGGWSDWSEWGPCEKKDCYLKTMPPITFRNRICNNPLPRYGGAMCQGAFMDASICMEETNCKVDGGWGEWSEWTCMKNLAKRTRICDSPPPKNSGKPCPSSDGVEFFSLDLDPESFKMICPHKIEDDEDFAGSGSGSGCGNNCANDDDEESEEEDERENDIFD